MAMFWTRLKNEVQATAEVYREKGGWPVALLRDAASDTADKAAAGQVLGGLVPRLQCCATMGVPELGVVCVLELSDGRRVEAIPHRSRHDLSSPSCDCEEPRGGGRARGGHREPSRGSQAGHISSVLFCQDVLKHTKHATSMRQIVYRKHEHRTCHFCVSFLQTCIRRSVQQQDSQPVLSSLGCGHKRREEGR